MNKPFNIHDWQAKQKQQRLDEQYYVTVNRGRGGGKRLVRSAESDYEEPRVFSNYGEAEKYIKQAKSGGATPGQITSYWVSDKNMNRIEDPVVAKEVMHTNDVKLLQDLLEKYSLEKINYNQFIAFKYFCGIGLNFFFYTFLYLRHILRLFQGPRVVLLKFLLLLAIFFM